MLGTLNFIDAAKRVDAAALVREGRGRLALAVVRHERPAEGLAPAHQPRAHDDRHRRRCGARQPGLPARHRRRRRRHRDAAAVLDAVGRARPHLRPRHGVERPARGRRRHERGRPRHGHRARGIRHRLARRAARRRPPPAARDRRAARTATRSRPPTSRRASRRRASSAVGRGDIVLVRTGQLARARRDGWGDYAGGPAPGLSLTTAGWLHRTEIAAIATDTWGFEVRPNEFDAPAFQPLHQVVIPNLGLTIGEMWDLERARRRLRRARPVRLPALGRRRCRSPAPSARRSTPSRSSEPAPESRTERF